MKYYIYDRNKEKYIFPKKELMVEYICCFLKEKVNREQIKKFLLGLNKEAGLFITVVGYEGELREDAPFDYFTDIIQYLRKEGRLVEEC